MNTRRDFKKESLEYSLQCRCLKGKVAEESSQSKFNALKPVCFLTRICVDNKTTQPVSPHCHHPPLKRRLHPENNNRENQNKCEPKPAFPTSEHRDEGPAWTKQEAIARGERGSAAFWTPVGAAPPPAPLPPALPPPSRSQGKGQLPAPVGTSTPAFSLESGPTVSTAL